MTVPLVLTSYIAIMHTNATEPVATYKLPRVRWCLYGGREKPAHTKLSPAKLSPELRALLDKLRQELETETEMYAEVVWACGGNGRLGSELEDTGVWTPFFAASQDDNDKEVATEVFGGYSGRQGASRLLFYLTQYKYNIYDDDCYGWNDSNDESLEMGHPSQKWSVAWVEFPELDT